MNIQGTGVALVTPFKDGQIDFDALAGMIDYVCPKVDYIVSLGSTGEAALLSESESREVLTFTIKSLGGRTPLVAGNFGDNNTRRLISFIESFEFTGIDAILSSCPSYVKPTQEGLYRHYEAVANASPVPVIMYNVPGRTGINMTAETTIRIAQSCKNIIGMKEASANMKQGKAIIDAAPEHFTVVSGDDPTALELIGLGAQGVISVIANAYPGMFAEMVNAGRTGQLIEARTIHNQLNALHRLLYIEGNPAGIKSALESLDLCGPEVRLPLTPLSHENALMLKSLMRMCPAY